MIELTEEGDFRVEKEVPPRKSDPQLLPYLLRHPVRHFILMFCVMFTVVALVRGVENEFFRPHTNMSRLDDWFFALILSVVSWFISRRQWRGKFHDKPPFN